MLARISAMLWAGIVVARLLELIDARSGDPLTEAGLTGFGGGLARKQWLLEREKSVLARSL